MNIPVRTNDKMPLRTAIMGQDEDISIVARMFGWEDGPLPTPEQFSEARLRVVIIENIGRGDE